MAVMQFESEESEKDHQDSSIPNLSSVVEAFS